MQPLTLIILTLLATASKYKLRALGWKIQIESGGWQIQIWGLGPLYKNWNLGCQKQIGAGGQDHGLGNTNTRYFSQL